MPIKVKNEDGTETEAFTQAELEEQASARADEAATKAREETETEKQVEIDRLNDELQKEKDKEKNFKALRDSKGAVPEEVTKQIETLSKRLEEIGQQPVKNELQNFKRANFSEDKDLNEK